MNKQEFFEYIRQRLEILDKKETEDILAEFDQHINNKIENGCTEEEAIADFGDPAELVEEILEAYKVNPDYSQPENNEKNPVGIFLKNFGNAINTIAESFFKKSKKELFLIILKFAILCLILALIKMPLDFLINNILNLFMTLPNALYQGIYMIIKFFFNLAYLLLACYTIYIFISKTFLSENGYKTFDPSDIKIKNKRKENNFMNQEQCDSKQNLQNETDIEKKSDSSILSEIKAKGYKFRAENQLKNNINQDGKLVELLSVCLKILIVFCMIPFIAYALFNFVALGASLILSFSGLPLIGITIAALGSLLCVCVFIIFIFKLIFKQKTKKDLE
jgi:uncharacterized membrane protein